MMFSLSKSTLLLGIFVAGGIGYAVGSSRSSQSVVKTVTVEHARVSEVHPAALYLRTETGTEQRYPIYDVDRNWASSLLQHPGGRWYLELESNRECPGRYTLRTLVEEQ
jgi:hypothetical protein